MCLPHSWRAYRHQKHFKADIISSKHWIILSFFLSTFEQENTDTQISSQNSREFSSLENKDTNDKPSYISIIIDQGCGPTLKCSQSPPIQAPRQSTALTSAHRRQGKNEERMKIHVSDVARLVIKKELENRSKVSKSDSLLASNFWQGRTDFLLHLSWVDLTLTLPAVKSQVVVKRLHARGALHTIQL